MAKKELTTSQIKKIEKELKNYSSLTRDLTDRIDDDLSDAVGEIMGTLGNFDADDVKTIDLIIKETYNRLLANLIKNLNKQFIK